MPPQNDADQTEAGAFLPLLALQILDETADGVLVTDQSQPGSPIVYANTAFFEMTGFAHSETLGRNCRFLQGEDRGQPEIATMRETVAAGRSTVVRLRNYRRDGSMFWNEVRLAPLHVPGQAEPRPPYYVGFQRDVTAHVTSMKELEWAFHHAEEANEARVRFLKAMGHEFRTPIGVITGFADLLLAAAERGTAVTQQNQYLGDIRAAAHHLLTLVDDARRYLRGATSADLRPSTVRLSAIVEGGIALTDPELRGLGARLHLADVTEGTLECDPGMLKQVVANVTSELARRAPRGADILVEPGISTDHAWVAITCSSLIMPPEMVAALRSPLSKEMRLHDRGLEGVGVALAVAERMMQLHGGDLNIWSEPGSGTTARVQLPRKIPKATA